MKVRLAQEKDAVSCSPPQNPSSFSSIPANNPAGYPLFLNVYNLLEIRQIAKFLKCAVPLSKSSALYHTSITYRENEYYYGTGGISRVADGQSSFGCTREQVFLGAKNKTRDEMKEFLDTLDNFTSKKYDLFAYDSNNFTNEASLALFDIPIPSSIQQTNTELANTPYGALLKKYQSNLKWLEIGLI